MIARHETEAWAGYYRREWRTVLSAAMGMVHEGFGMSRLQTVRGAYCVMRANRAWATVPDNDPDSARAWMTRFYALVIKHEELTLDPAHAAALEVTWWRLHRQRQYGEIAVDEPLVEALVDLYSYVYAESPASVRPAAVHRVRAMAHSDAWVAAGCSREDPLLADEHAELLASYTALSGAVARP